MCPLLGLVQFVFGSSCDDIFLMADVVRQHFFEVQRLRLVVDECQHDHAKRILQLCMFIQLVQHDIRIRISAQLDIDPHTLAV